MQGFIIYRTASK